MKGIIIFLLSVVLIVKGSTPQAGGLILPSPIGYGLGGGRGGGGGGSNCVIGRSIEIDGDDEHKLRQIPTSPAYDENEDYEQPDEEEEDEENLVEDYDDPYQNYQGYQSPYMTPYPGQYSSVPAYQYPMQYFGGMQSGYNPNPYAPSTSLSVSSEPNFGERPLRRPQKRPQSDRPSRGSSSGGLGGGSKKRGNINCIIITRGGGQKIIKTGGKKEPYTLFGIPIPFTRRRRSIAAQLRAIKSQ